jgi:hypothetical protein
MTEPPPDLVIEGHARAREVTVRRVSGVRSERWAVPTLGGEAVEERRNLPPRVTAGRRYRRVGVAGRLVTRLLLGRRP